MHVNGQRIAHTTKAGETVLDYLVRLHNGGPIVADCVAFVYIADAIYRQTDTEKPFEFIVVLRPHLEAFPEKTYYMMEPKHVVCEWDGKFYHMLPSGLVCSPTLEHAQAEAVAQL